MTSFIEDEKHNEPPKKDWLYIEFDKLEKKEGCDEEKAKEQAKNKIDSISARLKKKV
jgi:hypothetical protein